MHDDIFFVIIIISLAIHIQLLNAINTVLNNSSPFLEVCQTMGNSRSAYATL